MKYTSIIKSGTFVLSILLLNACSKGGGSNPTPANPKPKLAITSIDVTAGPYNSRVIITGTGFTANLADDKVLFNGKEASLELGGTTSLYADVPLAAGTGNITVTVDGVTATGPVFTYVPSLVVIPFVGNPETPGYADGTGDAAQFNQLAGMTIDKDGNLYVIDADNWRIRKITPQGVVTTLAGNGKQGHVDGPALSASFQNPTGITVDADGNVIVADGYIRKIKDGNVSTFATHLNIGNILTSSGSVSVVGIAASATGDLYITDSGDQFVGKVASDGTITAIAGNTSSGGSGFTSPYSLTVDKNNNLFIADGFIWKVVLPNMISKFAIPGFSYPRAITADGDGTLFVADPGNGLIKRVTSNGTITTYAGNSDLPEQFLGVATKVRFGFPLGIAVDAFGNVFVADDKVIREITIK